MLIERVLSAADVEALTAFGVEFSSDVRHPRLGPGATLVFSPECRVEPHSGFFNGPVLWSMGAFSYSWSQLEWDITVGRYCSIGANVRVLQQNHPLDRVTTSSVTYDPGIATLERFVVRTPAEQQPFRPVGRPWTPRDHCPAIGADVWIGDNVTLARGITLGDGCVVGAHALVTRSVPPYAIVGGNPARVIRYRFDDETVARLTASQWWRYAPASLEGLDFTDVPRFLDMLEARAAAGGLRSDWGEGRRVLGILDGG